MEDKSIFQKTNTYIEMKRLLRILLLTLFSVTFFLSCEKEEIIEINNTAYFTIKNTDDFTYDFNISGDEEGASIKLQANHFAISEIVRNKNTGWSVVYHYKPEPCFIGTDSVTIETYTGSDGANIGNTKLIQLYFQITD